MQGSAPTGPVFQPGVFVAAGVSQHWGLDSGHLLVHYTIGPLYFYFGVSLGCLWSCCNEGMAPAPAGFLLLRHRLSLLHSSGC